MLSALRLQRRHRAVQTLLICCTLALLLRAMVPLGLMLDPDAPPGSFGLVLCSGTGPMMSMGAAQAAPVIHIGGSADSAPSVAPAMRDSGHDPFSSMQGMDAMPGMADSAHASVHGVTPSADLHGDAGSDIAHGNHSLAPAQAPAASMPDMPCPFSATFFTALLWVPLLLLGGGWRLLRRAWDARVVRRQIRRFTVRIPAARAPPVPAWPLGLI